jgi:hypothetical protein
MEGRSQGMLIGMEPSKSSIFVIKLIVGEKGLDGFEF